METTALSLLSKPVTRSVSVEVMLPDPSLAFCLFRLKKGITHEAFDSNAGDRRDLSFLLSLKGDACP